MIAKTAWAFLPVLFWVQDARVCAHRDGSGRTQAVDLAAIEKGYAEKFSTAARMEVASTSWKAISLPKCSSRQTRRIEIAPVPEKVVGKKWIFASEPISPEVVRWFHLRCAPSTATLVDRTHLEIVEQ